MNKFFVSVAMLTALTSVQVQASEARPYLGVDFTYNKFGIDDDATGYVEDQFNAFKINAGVRLNRYVGIELFYQKSGEEEKSKMTDYEDVKLKTKVKFEAVGVDVKGYLPTSVEKLDVYGTVGLAKYDFSGDVKATNLVTGVSASEDVSEKNTGLRFGLGAEYKLDDHWSADVSGRYVKINSGKEDYFDDLKEFSLGVKYSF